MANKKIEIEIDVNSQQVGTATDKINGLNTATQNLETTTKDFGKGVKIVYDSTGKAIDVVTDSSSRLNRQSSALVNAMANLTAQGKQNSAEFTLLQRRHLELATTIDKTKGSSKDLFGTFSLLPGAVGQFAQELQVGVELMKVFGNLTLNGVKTQILELGQVVKDTFGIGSKKLDETKQQQPQSQSGAPTPETQSNVSGANGNAQARQQVIDDLKKQREEAIATAKATGQGSMANMEFDATSGKMVSRMENLQKASTGAKTAIQSQTAAVETLTAAETVATGATTLLEAALTALGIGLIIAALVKLGSMVVEIVQYYTRWGLAAEDAKKQIDEFNQSIKEQNQILDENLSKIDFETKKAELQAKAAKKGEDEIYDIQKEGFVKRKKLLDDELVKVQNHSRELGKEDLSKLSKEQQNRNYEQLIANGERVEKIRTLQIKNQEDLELLGQQHIIDQDARFYAKRLAELDAHIQLEILKNETDTKELDKLLSERANMVIKHDKLKYYQQQLLLKENSLKSKAAGEEDEKRIEAFQAKEEQIEISAIGISLKNQQTKEERLRLQKLNQDKLALSYDKDYQQLKIDNKVEADQILTNLDIAYENDLIKIRETYFLKEIQKVEARKTDEIKRKEQHTKNLLEKDKEYLIDGQLGFFGQALVHTKEFLDKKFMNMRDAAQVEHDNNKNLYDEELITLQTAYENKKLTDEEYANQKISINQKIADNDQTLVDKQIQLDKTLLDAKKATAAATIDIANNLVGLLNALGNFSTDWQITAAIAEAGLGIAKIIIATQVAIAEFSASVAELGPVGVAMAAAYAIKQKISAALGIAAITVGAVGRINQIKGAGGGASSGGGDTINRGKNYGSGGMIDGPSHANGGVPITAEGGEAVLTRGAVTMFRPLLSMMNQAGGGTSFSKGAVGQANYDNPKVQNGPMEPQIIKTYIVENELTSIQERQARLKNLSTL